MATCTNAACGAEIAAGDVFCGYCGTRQDRFEVADTRPGYDAGETRPVAGPLTSPSAGGHYLSGDGPSAPPATPPAWPGSRRSGFTAGAGDQGPGGAGAATSPGQESRAEPISATDALLGEAAPNAVYLGQRLLYEKGRDLEELDPLTSARWWREWLIHTLIVAIIYFVGAAVLVAITFILILVAHLFGLVFGYLLGFAWWLLMGFVYWLRRIPGQLSEWKFQVDDKGAAAAIAFDHIAWSFQRRGTPTDSVTVRRFQIPGQGSRDLLEIRQGTFYALVSCFATGNDLYIGWTMWLYQSFLRVFWESIKRLFWQLRFRGNAVYVSLQADRTKALREAIHSAVREGADVAAGQATPHGQGTLGSVIPVVTDNSLAQAPWVAASHAAAR